MGFVPGQDWASKKCRSLARFVEAYPERCQVAEAGNRLAGFVMWSGSRANMVGEVENLAVHPDFQGQGIARTLMEHAIAAGLRGCAPSKCSRGSTSTMRQRVDCMRGWGFVMCGKRLRMAWP